MMKTPNALLKKSLGQNAAGIQTSPISWKNIKDTDQCIDDGTDYFLWYCCYHVSSSVIPTPNTHMFGYCYLICLDG